MTKQSRSYGAWSSPITAAMLSGQSVRLSGIGFYQDRPCWLEGRPQDNGRSVLVWENADGQHQDLIPAPYNVRSRVHEYGGGAYLIAGDRVWFSHDQDQCIYQAHPSMQANAEPLLVTEPGPYRYTDAVLDTGRYRLLCVREDHSGDGEPRNALVAIHLRHGDVEVLASEHDFYASPCLSPDGNELAYLSWDHPNMPWDGTRLWRATVAEDGTLELPRLVAGGEDESIFQPQWSPQADLYFVSDCSGFWNLYRDLEGQPQSVFPRSAEFGLPQWQFAMSTYGFSDPETLVMASCENGIWQVQAMDIETGGLRSMPGDISSVSQLIAANGKALVLGASPEHSLSVVEWDLSSDRVRNIKPSAEMPLDPSWISKPQDLSFDGPGQTRVHSFFYPPTNPNFIAPGKERPPLIVIGHGGPTGATTGAFNLALQFWTSRGFAVLDVNYRGSTGYGRKYRALLDGQWGIADVEDCVAGAKALVESAAVDPDRLAIRGSSAGGFTTLAALVFHDVFRAGASYYGIGELEALARDTHKFESRYLDRLIGPYPETAALYQQRSPINHVQNLSCPVIFFQGLEDKVVPPNQALMMRDALREKGIPVACLLFESEQHGFRNAETIRQALQAELYFYGRVFGFDPADDLPEIEIENLATP